jgi:fumarate reductase subunit C
MPKTMPTLRVAGKPISEIALSAGGWTATVVVSLVVYALVRGL